MSASCLRRLARTALVVPVLVFWMGCSGADEPQLAKEPAVKIPESIPPEKQPKELRPSKNSSAGMNYDPLKGPGGGATGPPPGK